MKWKNAVSIGIVLFALPSIAPFAEEADRNSGEITKIAVEQPVMEQFTFQDYAAALRKKIYDRIIAILSGEGIDTIPADEERLKEIIARQGSSWQITANERTRIALDAITGYRDVLGCTITQDMDGKYTINITLTDLETVNIWATVNRNNVTRGHLEDFTAINQMVRELIPKIKRRLSSYNGGGNSIDPFPDDAWKNSRLYLGIRLGGAPQFYTLSDDLPGETGQGGSFEAAAQAAAAITNFSLGRLEMELSIQGEFLFATNRFIHTGHDAEGDFSAEFSFYSLAFAPLAKLSVRLMDRFTVSPLLGPYLTIPLGQMSYTNAGSSASWDYAAPAGLIVGVQAGMKFGPGQLLVDIRYAGDFGRISLSDGAGVLSAFSRKSLSCTAGYQIGLIKK